MATSEGAEIQGKLTWLWVESVQIGWVIDAMEVSAFVAMVFDKYGRKFNSKRWWEMVNEHREVS